MVSGVLGSGTSNNVPFIQSVKITNTGNATAGPFKVKTWLSSNAAVNANSQLLHTWDVDGLAAGGSLSLSASLTYTNASAHVYYYLVTMVDADSQITESNEATCNYPPGPTTGCNLTSYQFYVYR